MPKQLEFEKVKGWGGKRQGAGRKNRSGQVGHGKRDSVNFKTPLHLTMRLKPGKISLRNRKTLSDFRQAAHKAKSFGVHVLHYSLQGNHLHMIVESSDSDSLARGMKSFAGRFAKSIRRIIGGSGSVFNGRYHMHILKTPTEMKRALEYVLLNTAKHRNFTEYIDEFSSGYAFREWKKLLGRRLRGLIAEQLKLFDCKIARELSPPESWLARVGWMRA